MEGILKSKLYQTFEVGSCQIEGAEAIRPALPGDRIRIDPSSGNNVEILERAQHTLVGVLELAGKAIYGFTSRGSPIYLFVPWNESYPPFYVGSSHLDTTKNVVAHVEFESWAPGVNCPRGNLRRIFGVCGDLAAEEAGLLLHACPRPWKSVKQLSLLNPPKPASMHHIVDGYTFNVDPPGCVDIDDAVTFHSRPDGMQIHIHIADVSSYLATNPPLWRAAELGQTLYRDGAVVAGMLPPAVEEICSLLPGQWRQCVSLVFMWNGCVNNIRFERCKIMVADSYTYENIYGTSHGALLKEVASGIAGKELSDSHDWIAELMLFYNREVAKVLREAGSGILRRHSAPESKRLERLQAVASDLAHLAYKAGEYCGAEESDVAHWGLGTAVYCHASSPIRRWADCINQATLIRMLFDDSMVIPNYSTEELNRLSAIAKRYERDLFFVRTLLSVKADADTKLQGIVVDERKVWITEWKRLVTAANTLEPGTTVSIKVFMDPQQRNWKRRMVLEFV
jgi:exoribonuclease R